MNMITEIRSELEEKMRLFKDNTVINWHEHTCPDANGGISESSVTKLVYACERSYTDICLISDPVVTATAEQCTYEACVGANNRIAEVTRRYPKLFRGMCFVNPGHGEKALNEVCRCIDMGFVGVKLYHQFRIDDPVQYPLIEKCIDLDVPILMHAGRLTVGPESQPRLSGGEAFAAIAGRYPEAHLIMAHITGGGDWHWQLKAMEKYENVVLDMSGSVIDAPVIEECVKRLGASRVLYGTDGSTSAGVGKILGADISDDDKKTILEGTAYRRFIERMGR